MAQIFLGRIDGPSRTGKMPDSNEPTFEFKIARGDPDGKIRQFGNATYLEDQKVRFRRNHHLGQFEEIYQDKRHVLVLYDQIIKGPPRQYQDKTYIDLDFNDSARLFVEEITIVGNNPQSSWIEVGVGPDDLPPAHPAPLTARMGATTTTKTTQNAAIPAIEGTDLFATEVQQNELTTLLGDNKAKAMLRRVRDYFFPHREGRFIDLMTRFHIQHILDNLPLYLERFADTVSDGDLSLLEGSREERIVQIKAFALTLREKGTPLRAHVCNSTEAFSTIVVTLTLGQIDALIIGLQGMVKPDATHPTANDF